MSNSEAIDPIDSDLKPVSNEEIASNPISPDQGEVLETDTSESTETDTVEDKRLGTESTVYSSEENEIVSAESDSDLEIEERELGSDIDEDEDEDDDDDDDDDEDDDELEDLPKHERLEINSETGAVSGKTYENKYHKGTLPWIQTEHSASSKLLDEVEAEFERNRNVLKIAISMSRSARTLKDEKLAELFKYQDTRDSLASWIAERQGTYAWILLAALGKERDKLDAFEKNVREWTETTTTEIVEQSRKNKKRFIRRIGFGLGGVILALGLGTLVNFFLGWLGVTWLVTLLALIGFTNPFVWVPQVLLGGSVLTWLISLFSYFKSYLKWRRMVDRHVAEARYYVSAVKSLQHEKGRITSLHGQMEDYLKLLSEIIHKPWEISDSWINWETPTLDTSMLPTSLVVAKPIESGEYEAVRKRSLETFAATDWHSEQVRILFAEYEKAQKMNSGAMESRFDKDGALRSRLLEDFENSELLQKVGDEFVQTLAKKLQREDLPEATQFHVASLKPDILEKLDLSKNMFDDADVQKNWSTFVGEILGKATAWTPLAYSTSGIYDRLEKRSEVTSYALIPQRIKSELDSSVVDVIMDGDSGSGVEVVVRIDLSQWLDVNKVAILDSSKPAVALNPTAEVIAPQRVKPSNPTADPTGPVTF